MFTLVEEPDPLVTFTVRASVLEEAIKGLMAATVYYHRMAAMEPEHAEEWRAQGNAAAAGANVFAKALGR
jgi:hypothetical protein